MQNMRLAKANKLDEASVKDLADKVGLGALHLHSFALPSKLMHPTWWGTKERLSKDGPMYNTLNSAHHLLVETIILQRRHCLGTGAFTPLMARAVRDFLDIWVSANSSFGGVLQERSRDIMPIYY